jgi:hypothetical protein
MKNIKHDLPHPALLEKAIENLNMEHFEDVVGTLKTGSNVVSFFAILLNYPDWPPAIEAYKKKLTIKGVEAIKFIKENKVDFFRLLVSLVDSKVIHLSPIVLIAIGNLLYDEYNILSIVDSYPFSIKMGEEISIYESDIEELENSVLKNAILSYRNKRPRKESMGSD